MEQLAERWPFVIVVLISASLFLPAIWLFSRLPDFMGIAVMAIFAGLWPDLVRERLKAVGLPHSRSVLLVYGAVVFGACFLLALFSHIGRYLVPGLFVLLNLPLAVRKEVPSASE